MKKLILTLAFAVFGTVNGQFGLKAGLNIANISNTNGNSRAGFYGGMFYTVPISADFSIQPELMYSGKGTKTAAFTERLNYLTLPVMFQYKATPQFYLEAGPEFNFLLSAKQIASSFTADVKSSLNGFDFGLGLGAGYFFKPINLGITARYSAGFSEVIKNNTGSSSKNSVFQIGLAYQFSK